MTDRRHFPPRITDRGDSLLAYSLTRLLRRTGVVLETSGTTGNSEWGPKRIYHYYDYDYDYNKE